MKRYFLNVWKGRSILWSLVMQDLRARYRRSVLGIFWTVLMPLGLVLIIASVYSILFKTNVREFVPFLFSGLVPWNYIVGAADGGTLSFIAAEGYIRQLNTPIEIYPLRASMGVFINLLFSLIAFFAVVLILSPQLINLNTLMLFPALAYLMVLGGAMATVAAVINVYIRDYAPLQSLMFQALFYVTPIIYRPDMLGTGTNRTLIYQLNPFFYILEIIRRPLLGSPSSKTVWMIGGLILLFVLVVAISLMTWARKRIVFKL